MHLGRSQSPFRPPARWSLLTVALCAVALTLGVPEAEGGCGGAAPQPAQVEVGTRTDKGIFVNGLATSAFLNPISGNATALKDLINNPLNDASVNGLWHLQNGMVDPNAQAFMKYVVSCALDSTQTVNWTSPADGTKLTLTGSMGLCADWNTLVPTADCLERVSACVLSRNNAYGTIVDLSSRTYKPDVFTSMKVQSQTPGLTHYEGSESTVGSLNDCAAPTSGLGRNCGWAVNHVGYCAPGTTVTVGAGAGVSGACGTVVGSGSGDMMMRVCEGIRACDGSSPSVIAKSDNSCGTLLPATTFTCPTAGYFTVMTAPYTSGGGVTAKPAASGKVAYPASENRVFRVREGAFFGNIFDPSALDKNVNVQIWPNEQYTVTGTDVRVKGSIYKRMFSCSADGWSDPKASNAERVCASPSSGENCAAEYLGACTTDSTGTLPTNICSTNDSPGVTGDADFYECKGGGETFYWAVSVNLNDRCDIVRSCK